MQGIERHKGYVKALQEAGRPYDPEDVVWYHTEDRKMKPAIMLRLMEKEGRVPDGIVCYNDQIAAMLMEELEHLGYKVPEDVSVTGFDDSLFASGETGSPQSLIHRKNLEKWRRNSSWKKSTVFRRKKAGFRS